MIREFQSHRQGPVRQAMALELSTIWIRAWGQLGPLLPLLLVHASPPTLLTLLPRAGSFPEHRLCYSHLLHAARNWRRARIRAAPTCTNMPESAKRPPCRAIASTTMDCPPRPSRSCRLPTGSWCFAGGITFQIICETNTRTHSPLYAIMRGAMSRDGYQSQMVQAASPTGNTSNSGRRSTSVMPSATALNASRQ